MTFRRFLRLWLGMSSAFTLFVFGLFLLVEDDANDKNDVVPPHQTAFRIFWGLLQTFAVYEACTWVFDKLGIKTRHRPTETLVAAAIGGTAASLELNDLDYHRDDVVPDAGKMAAIFVFVLALYSWLRGRE